MLDDLFMEMVQYYSGDPRRIQHFFKVHGFSKLIGNREGLSPDEMEVLEAAAIVHDIGIKPAMEKYGKGDGKLQEMEGPAVAEGMLLKLGFRQSLVDRVCWLVAHHHTYKNIDGLDYQILVEADFLVNLYEGNESKEACDAAYKKIFKTETGKALYRQMYLHGSI
ncbi:MAG TPA: HD domain-containing protein [Anaerovoracaceae bacterium]|nr:HD domain-containing protein [Anaerovoracaceae bacterium]